MGVFKYRSKSAVRGIFERPPRSGVWWISYRGSDGKRHREKIGRRSAAMNAVARRRLEVKEGCFIPPRSGARLTFRDLATEALAQKKILLRPLSYQTDLWRLTKLYPFIGNVPAGYLSAARIEETLAQLCASMSGPTVNRFRSTISSVYSFAISTGKMTTNPVWGVKRRRENSSRLNATTSDRAAAATVKEARRPRERKRKPYEQSEQCRFASMVEQRLAGGQRSNKSIVLARKAVWGDLSKSKDEKDHIEYDTLAQYHQRHLRRLGKEAAPRTT